ncbi:cytochrome b/b6 domain-containing protein [Methylomonas sp. SURF-1]|uniref:Cytochrome b/b6 domain-containing protein n=1 Tax=Methylomonas aurea TaxID=2952224 RepID=A0ABT1UCL4_9GAMM|nr:cytochrome b/b6 domain-containing protein [Methylomonas sp. SURF-1]MCQ8179956.1 cytochrome b/b6 domain-containing protein [Methylomonas sp. SURF-1]
MQNDNAVAVWDIFVRVFHWSLVVAFAVAYVTSEEDNYWHIYAGYTVLGLISLRLIWGFVGGRYARFSQFVRSPAAVFRYVSQLRQGSAKHYLGHNPLGGWMVLALLSTLFVVTISGLKVYAIEEGRGPLAQDSRMLSVISAAHAEEEEEGKGKSAEAEDEAEEFWEEIHEIASNLMLLLIALHVLGVVISSKVNKEGLVKAMVTGRKPKLPNCED